MKGEKFRLGAALLVSVVGGILSMLDPAQSIIGALVILMAFALVAGIVGPAAAAAVGVCTGMATGAYLNRDNFADDPGFPAMLVPLGMVALLAIAAAYAGNLVTRGHGKSR